MMNYSYASLFKNKFQPHLEVMYFDWFLPKNVEKSVNTEQKMQEKNDFNSKNITNSTEITAVNTYPIDIQIRNITPKKHFWRK